MGLTSMTLMLTCLFVVRNQRVLASFEARQAEEQRRVALGLAPRTRRRRRQTITDLVYGLGRTAVIGPSSLAPVDARWSRSALGAERTQLTGPEHPLAMVYSKRELETSSNVKTSRVRPSGFEPETCGLRVRGRGVRGVRLSLLPAITSR